MARPVFILSLLTRLVFLIVSAPIHEWVTRLAYVHGDVPIHVDVLLCVPYFI
jgi:hypothetical protein